jgi:DNA mismatch endonuclease (patch repair protein)
VQKPGTNRRHSGQPPSASYTGFSPANDAASRIAKSASKKQGTRCETVLARELRKLGLRPALNVSTLPGTPDLVFRNARLVIFCDGDFWHGRNFEQRRLQLVRGHNAAYWLAKIESNMRRDSRVRRKLRRDGWSVIRVWEKDVLKNPDGVAAAVARRVAARRARPLVLG